eukprot:1182777-Prorocentrum_minimum.AAC.2
MVEKGEEKAERRVSKRKRQVAQGLRKVDKATREQVLRGETRLIGSSNLPRTLEKLHGVRTRRVQNRGRDLYA